MHHWPVNEASKSGILVFLIFSCPSIIVHIKSNYLRRLCLSVGNSIAISTACGWWSFCPHKVLVYSLPMSGSQDTFHENNQSMPLAASSLHLNHAANNPFLHLCPQILAEYLWLSGNGTQLRSQTRVVTPGMPLVEGQLPAEACPMTVVQDGVEVFLKPRKVFRDPFRGGAHILVMCDTFQVQGSDLVSFFLFFSFFSFCPVTVWSRLAAAEIYFFTLSDEMRVLHASAEHLRGSLHMSPLGGRVILTPSLETGQHSLWLQNLSCGIVFSGPTPVVRLSNVLPIPSSTFSMDDSACFGPVARVLRQFTPINKSIIYFVSVFCILFQRLQVLSDT